MSCAPQSNNTEAVELTIIVVSFGTRELTVQCLDTVLLETKCTSYEVIVVDNASTDGSTEAIAARFPGVRLVQQSDNLGFAAACNLAAAMARGRYLLLLNPDTVILNGAIDRLVEFAHRRPEAGIWGGRTLFADGSLNPSSCWRRQTLWSLFCSVSGLTTLFPGSPFFHSLAYGGWCRDKEREVDIVSGCFLLIESGAWQRLGGFSQEFYLYGEDADLCLRAQKLGFQPAITPEATIIHSGGGADTDRARKIRQVMTARSLLIRKHFPRLQRPLALLLLAAIPALGRLSGRGASRQTWDAVWNARHQWLAGRY